MIRRDTGSDMYDYILNEISICCLWEKGIILVNIKSVFLTFIILCI